VDLQSGQVITLSLEIVDASGSPVRVIAIV
jgi:kynurenine formamidase